MSIRTVLTALLLVGTPLSAQEDVNRQSFAFMGTRLLVNVTGDAPGELLVIRGEAGRVEAAARTDGGFSGFGLATDRIPTLQLSAVGADQVRYLVVVPERVQVSVQLPGRHGTESAGTAAAPRTFRWSETSAPQLAEILPTTAGGLYTLATDSWAPGSIDVPSLDAIGSISVRFEGASFRLLASRPVPIGRDSREHIRIDVTGEPVDLVIYVPQGRNMFTLTGGGRRLVETRGGRPYTNCGGVVMQQLSEWQHWFTFRPSPGQRPCEIPRMR